MVGDGTLVMLVMLATLAMLAMLSPLPLCATVEAAADEGDEHVLPIVLLDRARLCERKM